MFVINDDLSIYITRGDVAFFQLTATDENGATYKFKPGDVIRIKVFEKKGCENVSFQKDFGIETETETIDIFLSENETKIGEVISKPTDYWYEIELNPMTNPQTIIGYDEDGPKLFKLYPEGADVDDVPIEPEDIPIVDEELDISSTRPVQNQAIARAMLVLQDAMRETVETVQDTKERVDEALESVQIIEDRVDGALETVQDIEDRVDEAIENMEALQAQVVDTELSESSEMPVQNKAIAKAIKGVESDIDTVDQYAKGLKTEIDNNKKDATSSITSLTKTVADLATDVKEAADLATEAKETAGIATPEKYGAAGNGTTDDTEALKELLANESNIEIPAGKKYLVSEMLVLRDGTTISGTGTIKSGMTAGDKYDSVIKLSDGSNISDITIEGKGTDASHSKDANAIIGEDVEDVRIENVKITGVGNLYALGFFNAKNVFVVNCRVSGYSYAGIAFMNACQKCYALYNDISGGIQNDTDNGYAICVGYDENRNSNLNKNITIEGNTCENSSGFWEGIDVHLSSNIRIINNYVTNFNKGIAFTMGNSGSEATEDLVIKGNVIKSSIASGDSADGISVYAATTFLDGVVIADNIIDYASSNEKYHGVYLRNVINAVLYGNIVKSNINTLAMGGTCKNVKVYGCEFIASGWRSVYLSGNGYYDEIYINDCKLDATTRAIHIEGNNTAKGYINVQRNDIKNAVIHGEDYAVPSKSASSNHQCGRVGDMIVNSAFSAGGSMGWICTVASVAGESYATWTAI